MVVFLMPMMLVLLMVMLMLLIFNVVHIAMI